MRTIEGELSRRAARARRRRAISLAGRLALAYWRAVLWALNLLVALLYRLFPALRLDPDASRDREARKAPREE